MLGHVVNATTVQDVDAKTAGKTIDKQNIKQTEEKITQEGLTLGGEPKEITLEGFWEGLKLKKNLHFGQISEPGWKANKPIVTKVLIICI